jgi:hypothetical protein
MAANAPTELHTVTVYAMNGANPPLRVEPEQLLMGRNNEYVVISFILQTDIAGCAFPDTGAVVLTSPSLQFPLVARTEADGMIARLFDFNSDDKEYNYTVRVNVPRVESNDLLLLELELDPGIQNGD